jgi:hypothetical protein
VFIADGAGQGGPEAGLEVLLQGPPSSRVPFCSARIALESRRFACGSRAGLSPWCVIWYSARRPVSVHSAHGDDRAPAARPVHAFSSDLIAEADQMESLLVLDIHRISIVADFEE